MINGHGDDIYLYPDIRINFSSNVYNHFSHIGLFRHLSQHLDRVTHYPEPVPYQLEKEVAHRLMLEPEQVMVTNGATEAIYLIAQTFRNSVSAILIPTFAEYADACRLHEHQVSYICQLKQLDFNHHLLWLCNPSNPMGSVIPREQLLKSIKQHPHTLYIIDASYAPYTLQPLLSATEAATLSNVLMLHSMTKEYAIPGLRLGYITGSSTLIGQIAHQRMPWSVNQMAIEAGNYLLTHADEYVLDIMQLCTERERVSKALIRSGFINCFPSDTHILLCYLRVGRASVLKNYLALQHHLLIRDASNFEGLDESYFRIAIQRPEENDELIKAITAWDCL